MRMPDLVVLIDDAGPQPVPDIISGDRVVVVRLLQNSGPAFARNVGTRIARRLGSRLVCYMDADCMPDPSWVRANPCTQRPSPQPYTTAAGVSQLCIMGIGGRGGVTYHNCASCELGGGGGRGRHQLLVHH